MYAHAYSLVGVKLPLSDFISKERAFDHNFSEEWRFDPLTGKQLWIESNSLEELRDRNLDLRFVELADGSSVVVGVPVGAADTEFYPAVRYDGPLDLGPRIDEAKQRLESIGLPSDGVAFWTVAYLSY